MKILILGGTGAMGTALIDWFASLGPEHEVHATSRRPNKNRNNITFLRGDAHDDAFLTDLLKARYDAVVDFMSYSTQEFRNRSELFLHSAGQYVFISSARVSADSHGAPLTETSPRLLDVSEDADYLKTDEYALTKARQENILFESDEKNWTVVRPYITYNFNRLQLGIYEKEHFLLRALKGYPIVFSRMIGEKFTAMTYGQDVAYYIFRLIGNQKAIGEAFNIATGETVKWNDILEIYRDTLAQILKHPVEVKYSDSAFESKGQRYQYLYDRMFDRAFDNGKIVGVVGEQKFSPIRQSLPYCIGKFIQEGSKFGYTDWKREGLFDRECGIKQSMNGIHGAKNKLKYFLYRYVV